MTGFDGFLTFQETYFYECILEEGLRQQWLRAKCIILHNNCDGFISTTLPHGHSQGLLRGICSS